MVDRQGQARVPRIEVESTSRQSARVVEPIPLISLRDGDETRLTRRVVAAEIVENPNNPGAPLRVSIQHQKRARTDTPWDDAPPFRLSTMRAEEMVRIPLDSAETLALYVALQKLYSVARRGVPVGLHTYRVVEEGEAIVVEGEEREVLQAIMDREGGRFWELIESIEPDLLTAAAVIQQYRVHRAALDEFETEMEAERWSEIEWGRFFDRNPWIFGHALSYQILTLMEDQAYVGGRNVTGRGASQVDYLMRTEADIKFTRLVEIKKPTSALVRRQYRPSGVWVLDPELYGGVNQVLDYCRTWARHANDEENRRFVEDTYTVDPKGILVIGRLSTLDTDEKVRSFEMFRQTLHNPEILTFDEVLDRARSLVQQEEPAQEREPEPDLDDLEF